MFVYVCMFQVICKNLFSQDGADVYMYIWKCLCLCVNAHVDLITLMSRYTCGHYCPHACIPLWA